MRKVLIVAGIILLIFLVLGWFTGTWLDLAGARLWIFRAAFWLISMGAAFFAVWFLWRKKEREEAQTREAETTGSDELSSLIRDARSQLRKSGRRVGELPVVFVLGETGSAKTSVIVNSGLDAEALAGQVYRGSEIVATPTANFWFGQGTIFVEAAGRFAEDSKTWQTIARALQPRGLGAAVSSKSTGSTAALVTLDAETLMQTGGNHLAIARRLRSRLIDISKTVGVELPVYVLFTKLDRIPFFAEYVRNLDSQEAMQVLGAPVEMNPSLGGLYAEAETARLTTKFEALFISLCNWRLPVLDREHDNALLPAAYQFPRELRKLRGNLVQFMVDLCRPTELTVGPFLRGFYFSGVRPVEVSDAAPSGAPAAATDPEGGTRFFRPQQSSLKTAAAPSSRRVAQWMFLGHFFNNILLSDKGARTASGASTKTSALRRALLLTACGLCLLYAIAATWSYARNHAMESGVLENARALDGVAEAVPSLDSMRRLESLRQSVVLLRSYQEDGSPLSFRWGLNSVRDVYPQAFTIYFNKFRTMLLAPAQAAIVTSLRSLPVTPGPEYSPTYESLKAYLITTSNPDKSTRAFLSPVLTNRWSVSRKVEGERAQLAQKQFDFYSEQLRISNPYGSENDGEAITRARRYLNQFAGLERVYAAMLADAGKNAQAVNFNRVFPGSAETVVDGYEVPAAFTKQGWDVMRNSLKDPERYFSGEQWVLGDQTGAVVNHAAMGPQLETRYRQDFIKQWRSYLKSAAVVKYAGVADAAKKLNILAGNQSTLLALFSLASQNTAVDAPEVAGLFQAVQAIVPPGGGAFVAPSNQPYMTALLQLQSSVEAAAQAPDPTDDKVAGPTLANASAARVAVRQIGLTFRPDAEAHIDGTVQNLMEDPITNIEAVFRRLGPAELNAKGKDLCGAYRKLLAKYPFNSNVAAPPATVAEVNAVFHPPDGALWSFYESSLKKLLVKQGAQYAPVATPGAVTLNPAFVKFFNDSAALSDIWYAGASADPHFAYALKPEPTEGIQGFGIQIDGQSLAYTAGATPVAKQFTWQAKESNEVRATVHLGTDFGWSNPKGLWSLFQFFAKAESSRPSAEGETLEWIVRAGNDPMTLPNGKPLTVRMTLSMQGPPFLQKGYFAHSGCIAEVAK